MNILNNYNPNTNVVREKEENISKNNIVLSVKKDEYKPDVIDKISEKVVNKRDLNDMVSVPRSIFKGYMFFTFGTAVNAIGGLIKKDKITKGFAIAGSILSIIGTYNFVKPFLIREKELTKLEK